MKKTYGLLLALALGSGDCHLASLPGRGSLFAAAPNGPQGSSSLAAGDISFAMNDNATARLASGDYSTAMGYQTTASGDVSTAMGALTMASGVSSTAMGEETTASGSDSTAMGKYTKASGLYSTAMGVGTTASGDASTAMGIGTTASGSYSTAMGSGTKAESYAETVVGQYNALSENGADPKNWTGPDAVFRVGIGEWNSRKDALTVYKVVTQRVCDSRQMSFTNRSRNL